MSLLSITAVLSGMWRAVLFLPSGELPFQMEFSTQNQQSTAIIINASERIVAKEISYSGDSIFIRLPLYDSEIRAQINGNRMTGTFYNYNRADKNQIPFAAEHGLNYRFKPNGNNNTLPGKKWQILFGENKIAGYDAIGIFENKNQNTVWATFVIGSGDHRFLEGNFDGDSLFLSCFDGSHAFM
ncbi:MAG TPA: TlpA family protein disulfide reductase, partial [Bacteroidia bacterium]|nr:TlpA family protein disulfide reductase [Bacteroidia bacterium]